MGHSLVSWRSSWYPATALLALGLAALLLLPSPASAVSGPPPYTVLRDLTIRLAQTQNQASESEAQDIVSEASSAVSALAGSPGETNGMPNPVAAYYHGMRVANLLYHGHGWGTFARSLVGNVQSAVSAQLPSVAGQIAQASSNLSGVRDGIRLDQQAPDGTTGGPLSSVEDSHCSRKASESQVTLVATNYYAGASQEGGAVTVQGVYCDLADPAPMWRAIVEIRWTGQGEGGSNSSQWDIEALLVDTEQWTAGGVVNLDSGSDGSPDPPPLDM